MRLDGYIRVSRVNGRGGDSFLSPEQQRDKIEAFARVMGATIVRWHEDLDESGGKTDRPGLNAAMQRIEAGETGGLIVAKIDRFARAVEAYSIVRRILDAGAIFASADERLDPSTPMGKAMLQVVLVFAEMELDRIADNWADSRRRAVSRGVWIGPAPLGYVRGDDGVLEVDQATAPTVMQAFRLAAVDGLHAAGRYLADELPGQRWRKSDVRRVLSSRAYLGEHHAGGVGHEALVELATFDAAQTTPRARRSNGDYPLSHIATCQSCGGGLVGALQTVRGKTYRRMRCSNAGCTCRTSISADPLEAHVADELRAALSSTAFRLRFDAGRLDDLRERRAAAVHELRAFGDDTEAHELLGDTGWRSGLRSRKAKVDALAAEVQALEATAAQVEQLPAADQLDDPAEFKRALAVIGRVVIAPGRAAVADRVVAFDWVEVDDLDSDAGVLAA